MEKSPTARHKKGKDARNGKEIRHPDAGLTPEEALANAPELIKAREGLRRVMRVVEKDVNLEPDMQSPPASPIRVRAHMAMSPAFLSPRTAVGIPQDEEEIEEVINAAISGTKSPFRAREEQHSAIKRAIDAAKARRPDPSPSLQKPPSVNPSAHNSPHPITVPHSPHPAASPHPSHSQQTTHSAAPHSTTSSVRSQQSATHPAHDGNAPQQPQTSNAPRPAPRNVNVREKYTVCRLCEDGKYRRIPQQINYNTPFGTMDEDVTDEEQIRSMLKYIMIAYNDNKDLVQRGIFDKKDIEFAVQGGVSRVRRYMQYVYAQVGNKDMVFMISCGIDVFYMLSAFIMEFVFQVEMRSYYDRLRSNTVNLSAVLLRNPTVSLISKKVMPTSLNPENGSVEIWKILTFVGVQTVFGCAIAFALKKSGIVGGIVEGVASVVNDGAEGYLFKGRPFTESAKHIFEVIQPMLNRKEYTNEGSVDGEQVDPEVEEPS